MQSGKVMLAILIIGFLSLMIGGYVWYVYSPSFFDTSLLPQRADVEDERNYWRRMVDMPTARSEISAAVLDGKIYVVGGINGMGRTLTTVEVYDPVEDTWESVADLPRGVHHTAVAAHGGNLYVLGGYRGWGMIPQSNVFIYDSGTNTWSEGVSLPEPRGAHGAATVGDYIYIAGGVTGRGLTNSLRRFDINNQEWEELPSMGAARDHLAVAAVGDRILAAGGRERSLRKNLDTLEIFNVFPEQPIDEADIDPLFPDKKPPVGEWVEGISMPSARGGVTGTRLGNAIVVSGGEQLTGTFAEVEAYDVVRQEWYEFPPLNYARHGAASAVVDNTIYVIGGGRRPALSVSGINEAIEVIPR